jgi:hypothetical protein
MSNTKIEKLLQRRKELARELSLHTGVLHGTWVERYTMCSRKNCKCHHGEKHGPRYHLAVMEDGKQRQHYIRMTNKELAMKGLEHDRRIEQILQEMTKINLELMKEGAYEND